MVPVAEKERVKSLIKETLTLLCKNGLAFDRKFTIEALIGITIDEDDILLLSMNELIKSDQFDKKRSKRAPSLSSCDGSDEEEEEEEGLASMHRDVKLEYSPPAKRVKNKSAHSQNNQSNNHSADNGSQELSVIDKSEVLIECEDLREDSEDDIIIKQEVDDQVAWMSPDPETSHPALMSPDPETSHPALMLPGTADTYQNTNIFTSPTGFYPGQSRTSTATSTDANTSEQQRLIGYGTNITMQTMHDAVSPSIPATAELTRNRRHSSVGPFAHAYENDKPSSNSASERWCEVCGKYFMNAQILNGCDAIVMHSQANVFSPNTPTWLGCTMQRRSDFSEVFLHSAQVQPDGVLEKKQCNECGKYFMNAQVCRRHKKELHDPQKEVFFCPIEGCPTVLARKSKMRPHLLTKHSIVDPNILSAMCREIKSRFRPRS